MLESLESFRRKIDGANELQSVVKNMKSLAASSLNQYEQAVISLQDYFQTIEISLAACLREFEWRQEESSDKEQYVILFGSDQGLVGQFNNDLVDFAFRKLKEHKVKHTIYAIGDKIESSLEIHGLAARKVYDVPGSVKGITPFVHQLLLDILPGVNKTNGSLIVYNHKPLTMPLYEPVVKHLLPLNTIWEKKLKSHRWPTSKKPEIIGNKREVLLSLINEYLFVSLFQSCAESLASENSSRMASMQRAEKNIEERLEELQATYNQFRQNKIDDELFEVLAGFEALKRKKI